ncbi:hypothetical protein K490DRAFT_33778 [Saccharata proteae CBS 121410]|uniref:CWH43-like N-terminal domain-containing protein n=1 Tax=Saccharata proteae CBS 121410 TaxID=1314787 RepID=A0A9P4I0W1_9PEZI|nr:hypothetical protein K490DRAFT_33778 [Saccharata proteae CBS 121410]
MWGISYWIIPIFSGCVWLAMLLGMLLVWVTNGKPHYSWMSANQRIAYISDIGASDIQPLFIAMGAVTVVTFDLVFITERWLRHRGRLAENTSWWQKGYSIVAIIFAIIGAVGLICLTIFNDRDYHRAHDACLVVFIGGYIVSAIAICAEYQRLGIHHRQHRILRISFWVKLTFIFVELALAIAFGVLSDREEYNRAAILEWVIALIYTFYVWSFFIDFIPAFRTKHHQSRETEVEMAEDESSQRGIYDDGAGAGTNVYRGNGFVPPANQAAYKPQPSRNF